jgi:hypothetical protein
MFSDASPDSGSELVLFASHGECMRWDDDCGELGARTSEVSMDPPTALRSLQVHSYQR